MQIILSKIIFEQEEKMLVDIPNTPSLHEYSLTLMEDREYQVLAKGFEHSSEHLTLDKKGNLLIKEGFHWNGATGLESKTTLRMVEPTLIHDAMYKIMVLSNFSGYFREITDKDFKQRLLDAGIKKHRATAIYFIVRMFGPISFALKWFKG